jgi:uncharacterized protein YbjT (DUF2867 family)
MRTTIVRANGFMQGILTRTRAALPLQTFRSILKPSTQVSFVDLRDVAEVAVAKLVEPDGPSATIEVTGPEPLTVAEMADAFTRNLHRPITYEFIDELTLKTEMARSGSSDDIISGTIEAANWYDTGRAAIITGDVAEITGHAPRTFDRFVADNAKKLIT